MSPWINFQILAKIINEFFFSSNSLVGNLIKNTHIKWKFDLNEIGRIQY
jgi:hypothetical protein